MTAGNWIKDSATLGPLSAVAQADKRIKEEIIKLQEQLINFLRNNHDSDDNEPLRASMLGKIDGLKLALQLLRSEKQET